MPIYEYHCSSCNKDHEMIQKVGEAPLMICPACGGKLEKKMSLSGFQLKGGGWYKDGYSSSTSSPGSASKVASKEVPKGSKPQKEASPAPAVTTPAKKVS